MLVKKVVVAARIHSALLGIIFTQMWAGWRLLLWRGLEIISGERGLTKKSADRKPGLDHPNDEDLSFHSKKHKSLPGDPGVGDAGERDLATQQKPMPTGAHLMCACSRSPP
jgi:hypothetical protein